LSFRQYIPSKAHKYGIKFFELCTNDGFVLDLVIYKGKGTIENDTPFTFGIVDKLMSNYYGKGHTIYMDNYYNSIPLTKYLLENKTSNEVMNANLKKGEAIHAENGNIHVIKWRDKRDVFIVSTKHNLDFTSVINKFGKSKFKPAMVFDYNNNMSGIDRADQMISYYPSPRKCLRWYIKVFFHAMDICLWNANYLYNKQKPCISHLDFRRDVVSTLLGISNTKRFSIQTVQTKQTLHLIQKVPIRKRCRLCHTKKIRKTTLYVCNTCQDDQGKTIGLCSDPCFAIYHS